jgi:uncharacterized protein (TIGR02996 family)
MLAEADAMLRAALLAPKDAGVQGIYADWLEEHGRKSEADALRQRGRMLLGADDRKAATALLGCNFAPATFDKRFVRDVCTPVYYGQADELTPAQRACLWRLVWRYRRQIGACYVTGVAALLAGLPEPAAPEPELFSVEAAPC